MSHSNADDIERALGMMLAVQADASEMHYLTMPGDPPSKARPRFGKGGNVFTPAESRKAEKRTSGLLRESFTEPMTGNVALVAIFHRSGRQRIDVDNMLKHVCDAANGIIWDDDSQVTAILGVAELDSERPRTLLVVSPHVSTLTRGTDATKPCERCTKPFSIIGINAARKYCSTACGYAARVNSREPVECRQCGETFRRSTNRQVLCSPGCRVEWLRGSRKAAAKPNSYCTECAAELSHKRGGRCRACWKKSPLAIPAEAPPITESIYEEGTLL